MNKIIIENNILKEVDNEVFSVHANQITIKKNGEYTIEPLTTLSSHKL